MSSPAQERLVNMHRSGGTLAHAYDKAVDEYLAIHYLLEHAKLNGTLVMANLVGGSVNIPIVGDDLPDHLEKALADAEIRAGEARRNLLKELTK